MGGFFQKRGYEDASDLKKNKISQIPAKQSSKEFVYEAKTIFDKPNNAKLKDRKALEEAGKFLEQNKFSLAVVAACDEVGDSEMDCMLTQARANVVRDNLVENFKFDDARVKIIGLGKSSKAGETSKLQVLVYF